MPNGPSAIFIWPQAKPTKPRSSPRAYSLRVLNTPPAISSVLVSPWGQIGSADAIGLLKQAAELDPTMVRPLLALANIYFAQQELRQAAEWYERALKVAPSSADVRVARGHFLFATGTPEEGRKEFQKAVELSPDQEHVRLVLADRYVALGRRDDAEHELAGLTADMNSHKARKALAELKLAAGQVAETKTLVSAILEDDEHDPVGIYLKGRIALAENDVPQAVGLFEESIGRNATLSGPHLYLGLARLAQGRVDSAQEALREAIRLQPDNEAAHLTLAKLYLAQQKQAEAEKEAWQALRLNPANLEAAVLYGDAFVWEKLGQGRRGVWRDRQAVSWSTDWLCEDGHSPQSAGAVGRGRAALLPSPFVRAK